MLTDSPLLRSPAARALFLVASVITVSILLSMHQMRLSNELHGLATSFFVLFAYEDYGATVVQLLILIVAVFLSSTASARRIIRMTGEHPWRVAGITVITLSAGALLVYHNHPLSMDEYSVYFQSQVFAAGHLAGHFPPATMDWLIPPGFQNFFLNTSHVTGQVATSYWPGFSLILAPFTFAGIPWACNPTLTA